MIKLTVHRAILHTSGMATAEKIAAQSGGTATLETILLYKAVYLMMDGQEAIVIPYWGERGKMCFIGLTDPSKDRELSYLLEQDPEVGCFIDSREDFNQAYDAEEYSRQASFILDAELVEIIDTEETP